MSDKNQKTNKKMAEISSVGMMHSCFKVGKGTILCWLKDFYQVDFNKVEDGCDGAIYCQILDSLFPGEVSMTDVNWEYKNEWEYLKNWKIVQRVLTNHGVTKQMNISVVCKGRMQSNLALMQWFKYLFDEIYDHTAYNAVARRTGKKSRNS